MTELSQTATSFRNKWEQNRDLAFAETTREGSDIFNWILARNGFAAVADFEKWLGKRERILDAGCGNGRVTALIHNYAPANVAITGIDLTAAEVASENLKLFDRVEIQEGDLLGELSHLGQFELIYCQEVLHHTADPRGAFFNLCDRLAPTGEIAIYVYKIKAPIREFADDFIRDRISELSYEDALKAMREVTELGRALSNLDVKVTLPDVNVLGIDAGEYDVQRFIYHFFLKCFWNSSLAFEENAAINYDWYHPQLCTRHTLEEVQEWFSCAGLEVIHQCVDHYGITVRGVKSI